jgi:hypothetical protein
MTGRHIHDQPLQAAICDTIEGVGHDFMVTALNERGPHLPNERQELVLGVDPASGIG